METEKKQHKRIPVALPDILIEKLDAIADVSNISRTAVIRLILEQGVREIEKKGGLVIKLWD